MYTRLHTVAAPCQGGDHGTFCAPLVAERVLTRAGGARESFQLPSGEDGTSHESQPPSDPREGGAAEALGLQDARHCRTACCPTIAGSASADIIGPWPRAYGALSGAIAAGSCRQSEMRARAAFGGRVARGSSREDRSGSSPGCSTRELTYSVSKRGVNSGTESESAERGRLAVSRDSRERPASIYGSGGVDGDTTAKDRVYGKASWASRKSRETPGGAESMPVAPAEDRQKAQNPGQNGAAPIRSDCRQALARFGIDRDELSGEMLVGELIASVREIRRIRGDMTRHT